MTRPFKKAGAADLPVLILPWDRIALVRVLLLVTLWPLNDGGARDFMVALYRTWLSQAARSDPARELRETRLTYLNNSNPALRDPRVWAPYVLVE